MLDWNQCSVVERIPGKVSGAWLFKGTHVPVAALFQNCKGGATVENFPEWFPGVSREQVEAVLKHAEQSLEVALMTKLERLLDEGLENLDQARTTDELRNRK